MLEPIFAVPTHGVLRTDYLSRLQLCATPEMQSHRGLATACNVARDNAYSVLCPITICTYHYCPLRTCYQKAPTRPRPITSPVGAGVAHLQP